VEYSVSFAITEPLREAIDLAQEKLWTPALDAYGDVRESGDVAELTGLIDKNLLVKWPGDMRVILRRERPQPGAQLSLFEERDGWRCRNSSATPRPASWLSSRPGTGLTPESRTDSATRKTRAGTVSHPASSTSTRPQTVIDSPHAPMPSPTTPCKT